jgi:dienelactone hydrolase
MRIHAPFSYANSRRRYPDKLEGGNSMKRIMLMGLIVFLTVILIGCATTTTVTFKGSESLTLKGTLIKQKGDGPFPAVVLLHGCDGMGGAGSDLYRMWASRLKSWGYITLLVDSFAPRGDSFICSNDELMKKYVPQRAMDAHDAQSYLAGLRFVDPKRIAVMGWSHGALSTIASVSEMTGKKIVPFQASIAFYPYCYKTLDDLDAPLMILIGGLDDWCPAELCSANIPKGGKTKHEVVLKVYPGAYHSFDFPGMDVIYMGHVLQYNGQAASDSILQVKKFLEKHLK